MQGSGCPKCGNIQHGLSKRITLENFIKISTKIHKGKYDYSKVKFKYNNDRYQLEILDFDNSYGYVEITLADKLSHEFIKVEGKKIENTINRK
jgi:hypothetical protein